MQRPKGPPRERSEEERKRLPDSKQRRVQIQKEGENKRRSRGGGNLGIQMRKGLVAVGSSAHRRQPWPTWAAAGCSNLGLEMVPAEQ
jgi:hypothetical protein